MTVEYFEIVPTSIAQEEDAGWYFQQIRNGAEVGAPVGPFPTKEAAVSGTLERV